MRILFQYFSGGGGGLSNIILLLKTLSRIYPQDQILVVCAPGSDLSSLSTLPNVEVIFYGGYRHKEVDRLLLGYFGLKRLVEQYHVDIVWSLNVGSYSRLKVPHVLSVNNAYQVYPLNDVAQYHPKSRFTLIFLRTFFQKTLRLSSAVILQTSLMKDYVQKIKGAPRGYVVAKAVERDEDMLVAQLPVEMLSVLDKKNADFTFLYVATNSPHKNYQVLVDAFDLLSKEFAHVRLILTISAEELILLAGDKAKRLIDAGYIAPVGWVKKEYLKALYQTADACLMPSVLESLSSAHLEAMMWGKPQIVSDLPFSRDLCGGAAVYVSAVDANQWVKSIRELVGNTMLQQELIRVGHERMELFPKTWDDVAHQIHLVFDELVHTSV
jgi:glycosyltransferase involved in cell wall biosynthesis